MGTRHLYWILTDPSFAVLVSIKVYRLEIQSVMLYFRPSFVKCCPSNLLVEPPPPSPLPCVNKYTVYTYTVLGGEVMGFWALKQVNTCRKVHVHINFFRWRHFVLSSVILIFLRERRGGRAGEQWLKTPKRARKWSPKFELYVQT